MGLHATPSHAQGQFRVRDKLRNGDLQTSSGRFGAPPEKPAPNLPFRARVLDAAKTFFRAGAKYAATGAPPPAA